MTRNELIDSFAAGYDKLRAALDVVPAAAVDYKPSPTAWSVREIIIHMPDSEASGFIRCRKIIAQSGVTVDAYDQDAWADRHVYRNRDMDSALELFKQMRIATVELLGTVAEPVWTKNYVTHPEDGRMTLDIWLEAYARHVDKHVGQIKRNIDAWERAGRPAP